MLIGTVDRQRGAGKKMTEQVMVFQQIVPSQNLERVGGDNPSGGNNQKLINGVRTPTFTMAPGEIQMWRLVNAMGGGGKGTLDFSLFQEMINRGSRSCRWRTTGCSSTGTTISSSRSSHQEERRCHVVTW